MCTLIENKIEQLNFFFFSFFRTGNRHIIVYLKCHSIQWSVLPCIQLVLSHKKKIKKFSQIRLFCKLKQATSLDSIEWLDLSESKCVPISMNSGKLDNNFMCVGWKFSMEWQQQKTPKKKLVQWRHCVQFCGQKHYFLCELM